VLKREGCLERRGFDELNAKLQALNFKVSGVRKKKQRIQ
jgi:hypothetical protein